MAIYQLKKIRMNQFLRYQIAVDQKMNFLAENSKKFSKFNLKLKIKIIVRICILLTMKNIKKKFK